MRVLRHLDGGAGAAQLLVQQSARRVPGVHRARRASRGRPRRGGPRPVAEHRRGCALGLDARAVAALDDGGARDRLPALQDSAQRPVEGPRPPRSAGSSSTGCPRTRRCACATSSHSGHSRSFEAGYEGVDQQPAAALSRDRVRVGQAGDRAPDDAEAVPDVQRRAAQARVPRGDHRRDEHRRVLQAQHQFGVAAPRLAAAQRARADHRAPGDQGDQGAPRLPARRRARLHHHRPRRGDAVRRRGAAHPARDADRQQADGRALHPRRAVDRAAPARQPQADPHADRAARHRQHAASSSSTTRRRSARPTGSSTSAPAPASTAAW